MEIAQRYTQQALCASYPKESKKAELITLATVGMTMATVVVAARCYSRLVTVRRLWWDDWTAVISLVCSNLVYIDLISGIGID